jgi:NAD(P)-dependent dehydrogenase (short-subunit alcohol dehydrogenase family)
MHVPPMCVCGNIFREKTLASVSKNLFSVAGKTALITGGGSGIGGFMAQSLADEGARILLVGRREDKLKQVLGGRDGSIFVIDLTETGASQRLFKMVTDCGYQPDIIVNAAGINPRLHADEIDEEMWNYTVHLNLNVPFLVAQKFVPAMQANRWGRIINIASMQSSRAFPNGISYGAAKGGVTQLTRAMAEAWSALGVTANALAPGFFPTDLTSALFADPKTAADLASRTAVGRNGELEDLLGPLLFLASDAGAYITGQMINVDGGMTAK